MASSAINGWSVDTHTELKTPLPLTASKEIFTKLRPPTFRRFFRGTPLEPPRAKIRAATWKDREKGFLLEQQVIFRLLFHPGLLTKRWRDIRRWVLGGTQLRGIVSWDRTSHEGTGRARTFRGPRRHAVVQIGRVVRFIGVIDVEGKQRHYKRYTFRAGLVYFVSLNF